MQAFPNYEVDCDKDLAPPYVVEFDEDKKQIAVGSYEQENVGPYEHCRPKLNQVPFTPVQVEAIRSGINHGLTCVVGPPGTGKTDTAVQIVNLIYHSHPDQKMLLVAHSNQALNDLFEKIVKLDIPERYLVRMGHSAKDLETEQDFSKWGRVNHMLKRRLEKLAEVKRLATSLGITDIDVGLLLRARSIFPNVARALSMGGVWQENQARRQEGREFGKSFAESAKDS